MIVISCSTFSVQRFPFGRPYLFRLTVSETVIDIAYGLDLGLCPIGVVLLVHVLSLHGYRACAQQRRRLDLTILRRCLWSRDHKWRNALLFVNVKSFLGTCKIVCVIYLCAGSINTIHMIFN